MVKIYVMIRDVFHYFLCAFLSFALARTPSPISFNSPFSFCPSVGRDRDRHKKDGPVSGVENGPYCFTRDLRSGGKTERKAGREGENSADH